MAKKKWTEPEREHALGLRREGKSYAEIERLTGIPTSTVSQWVNEGSPPPPDEPPAASFVNPPDDGAAGQSYEHRAADAAPARPRDGKQAPVDLDYGELQDYIASFYKLSASLAAPTDEALASAILAHAEQAGSAWAEWVRSEPRVAAMLQRLMIGTPLGKVIGVHVSIGIAYFLARNAQRDISAAAAAATSGEPVAA